MRIKVTSENLDLAVLKLGTKGVRSLDTETTGLRPFHGDRPFCVTTHDGIDTYFFSLDEEPQVKALHAILTNEDSTWYGHNIKFDLHHLKMTFNIDVHGQCMDTKTLARLAYNEHMDYSLEACAKRIGLEKSSAVEDYISEHHLWEWEEVPGKKSRKKNKFYHKVPHDLIFEYACQDAEITYKLGEHLRKDIAAIDALLPNKPELNSVALQEFDVLKVIQNVERRGIHVDLKYSKEAYAYYQKKTQEAEKEFKEITGKEYKASPKLFAEIFVEESEKWIYTEKGNPSFDSDAIKRFSHPAAKQILIMRDAKSRMDFFAGFQYHADSKQHIHPNLDPSGTGSGRFSSSDPNFQNLTNDEEAIEEAYPVRKAVIPPNPNYCIVAFDYDQQEYRLMLEYAGEMDVIEKVKAGVDVHQATADMMGTTRKYAKCVAEDSLVLTNTGLKKIQNVTCHDLVWDGTSFVTHQGVVFKGFQNVITYQGLKATPDHKVYTECGEFIPLQEAKERQLTLARTEVNGIAIRYTHGEKSGHKTRRRLLHGMFLQSLLQNAKNHIKQFPFGKIEKLPVPKKPKIRGGSQQNYGEHKHPIFCNEPKMQQSKVEIIPKLWRAGGEIAFLFRRITEFFIEHVFRKRDFNTANRPNKQRWGLLPRQYKITKPKGEFEKYKEKHFSNLQGHETDCYRYICADAQGLSSIHLGQRTFKTGTFQRSPLAGTFEKKTEGEVQEKVRVYDIQNAGPNFRFTCSGVLVSNCLNFLLLYGGGVSKLAEALHVPESEAKDLRDLYFSRLPKVKEFIATVIKTARDRGYVYNWLGRRFFCERDWAYKMPNRIIQGGGADVMKKALVGCQELLNGTQSRIFLTVHDEIDFYIHAGEFSLIPKIKKIMEEAYPHRHLPLTVSISHSWVSLGDLKDGGPEEASQTLRYITPEQLPPLDQDLVLLFKVFQMKNFTPKMMSGAALIAGKGMYSLVDVDGNVLSRMEPQIARYYAGELGVDLDKFFV